MKKNFVCSVKRIKMKQCTNHTRMCDSRGVDELKISDQGRLKQKSFSQETTIGQQESRIDERPRQSTVQDAHVLAHLPSFFLNSTLVPSAFNITTKDRVL